MTMSHDGDSQDRLEQVSEEIQAAAAALTRARRLLVDAARERAASSRRAGESRRAEASGRAAASRRDSASGGDDAERSADRGYAIAELGLLADMALDLKIQVDTARALAENAVVSAVPAADAGEAEAPTAVPSR